MPNAQLPESKRRVPTRSNKPADEMAPVVRAIAFDEFTQRPNTERIARTFGSGRLHVSDAVVYELIRRMKRLEARLGIAQT